MAEPIRFQSELYDRRAIRLAAAKLSRKATFEITDAGEDVLVTSTPATEPGPLAQEELRGEFLNAALSATVRELRGEDEARPTAAEPARAATNPFRLLVPFSEGASLALGWTLGSLGPIRSGGAVLDLRHPEHGTARVLVRRNAGAPRGVAHTKTLDFLVQNGGNGSAPTEPSLGRVLVAFAAALDERHDASEDAPLLAELEPHGGGGRAPESKRGSPEVVGPPSRRISPTLDLGDATVTFQFDDTHVDRLSLYDAVLGFADRSYAFLSRAAAGDLLLELTLRERASPDAVKTLARDATKELNRVARSGARSGGGPAAPGAFEPAVHPAPVRLDALLAELAAADATTLGLGFSPKRGPEHEDLRVLNVRGTGACNSDCVFCVEKFDPSHRSTPNADATRQVILGAENQFDMLFFASGEPTIHPKLFEYVDLAKTVGFTSFGMSSHFRTFSDPAFALRALRAGFRYFDISLHAADPESQLAVNPIADDGRSLHEALKGLAVLYRLADALGVPISVTQKIVVSRLNLSRLEEILRATYERGVRHFILQPVKTLGLAAELQTLLAVSEEEVMPHLNELIRKTEGLGVVVKPYGFSRQDLVQLRHVETEQNRVKNVFGRVIPGLPRRIVVPEEEERPSDGRHWVKIRLFRDTRGGPNATRPEWGFAAEGSAPLLDQALERGMDASYGCRMGSCGMCCAKLIEGQVDQNGQIFLDEAQIRAGYVLLCQARPLTDVVLEVCTDREIDAL